MSLSIILVTQIQLYIQNHNHTRTFSQNQSHTLQSKFISNLDSTPISRNRSQHEAQHQNRIQSQNLTST